MTHGSVFSGIGGPEVAASMLGWENLFHCEINPFGRKILDYYYPNAESYEDITKTDFTKWRGRVNVLTGGFPCQPFSYAGQRRGAEDDRYLWPHMHRCINEIQPDWVVCENVAGITTMVEQGDVTTMASAPSLFDEDNSVHRYQYRGTFTLERICCDLEADGYEVQPILIPACSVGAPHRRDRVFIVGRRVDADTNGRGGSSRSESAEGNRQGADNLSGQTRRGERPASVGDNGLSAVSSAATDTSGSGQSASELESERAGQKVQRESGVESFDGVSRPCTSQSASDTHGPRREESKQPERGENQEEESARVDDRTQRPCTDGSATDTNSQRFGGRSKEDSRGWSDTSSIKQGELLGIAEGCCGSGIASNPSDAGLQYGHQSRSESCKTGEIQGERCDTFWDLYAQANGYRGETARAVWDEMPAGGRWKYFPTVSPVHRGDDGLPFAMDDLALPFAKWRNESLKAYGNAIVPQVMYEIFRAIEKVEEI